MPRERRIQETAESREFTAVKAMRKSFPKTERLTHRFPRSREHRAVTGSPHAFLSLTPVSMSNFFKH